MNPTLFCGVDLHSNNAMYVITDGQDKQLLKKRLPNELPVVLKSQEPFRRRLKVVAVESTYNWYWLYLSSGHRATLRRQNPPPTLRETDGVQDRGGSVPVL